MMSLKTIEKLEKYQSLLPWAVGGTILVVGGLGAYYIVNKFTSLPDLELPSWVAEPIEDLKEKNKQQKAEAKERAEIITQALATAKKQKDSEIFETVIDQLEPLTLPENAIVTLYRKELETLQEQWDKDEQLQNNIEQNIIRQEEYELLELEQKVILEEKNTSLQLTRHEKELALQKKEQQNQQRLEQARLKREHEEEMLRLQQEEFERKQIAEAKRLEKERIAREKQLEYQRYLDEERERLQEQNAILAQERLIKLEEEGATQPPEISQAVDYFQYKESRDKEL